MLEKSLALLAVQVEDDVPHTEHVTPLHVRHGLVKRQTSKISVVFVGLSFLSSTEPAVINNFYAKTRA
jgi:hypothetical protein